MKAFTRAFWITAGLIVATPAFAQSDSGGDNRPVVNDTPTSAGHMYTPGTGQPVNEGQRGNVHTFDFDQAPAPDSRVQNTDE